MTNKSIALLNSEVGSHIRAKVVINIYTSSTRCACIFKRKYTHKSGFKLDTTMEG